MTHSPEVRRDAALVARIERARWEDVEPRWRRNASARVAARQCIRSWQFQFQRGVIMAYCIEYCAAGKTTWTECRGTFHDEAAARGHLATLAGLERLDPTGRYRVVESVGTAS